MTLSIIHHVSDRLAHFREAYRVLRPGGQVCMVTDSESIIRTRQPQSVFFPETVEVEPSRYPPKADSHNLMERVGFTGIGETTSRPRSQREKIAPPAVQD